MESFSLKEGLGSPDKAKWITAEEKRIKVLVDNDIWDLVELPKDRNSVARKNI